MMGGRGDPRPCLRREWGPVACIPTAVAPWGRRRGPDSGVCAGGNGAGNGVPPAGSSVRWGRAWGRGGRE